MILCLNPMYWNRTGVMIWTACLSGYSNINRSAMKKFLAKALHKSVSIRLDWIAQQNMRRRMLTLHYSSTKKCGHKSQKNEGLRFIYEKIEIPTLVVLQKMERNGVLIDPERLLGQSSELGTKMDELEKSAYRAAEQAFNLNSPKQLAEILFDKLGLPMIKKTPSGAPSTSEEVLEKLSLDYPLPKIILDYRGMSKLKSTYTDKLPRMINAETGRVHTNYAQAVAVTGRLASSDPNLQNIPVKTEEGRRIREAFIARGKLYCLSRLFPDRTENHGSSVGRFKPAQGFSRRTGCPSCNSVGTVRHHSFGSQSGTETLRQSHQFRPDLWHERFRRCIRSGISRTDAKNYIDRYFQRYPGVAQYMDNIRTMAREQGYVETVFGRRTRLPEINSPNGPRRQAAERAAINAPMQGTAADIIKLSMIEVENWLENEQLESKLIMQVHDELVLEVPDKELDIVRKKLPELMGSVARLKVPLIAEVGFGKNWDEAH